MLFQGIIDARTVNSTWLSQCSAAPESVKSASFLRCIQRFFTKAVLSSKSIGAMLLSWLPKSEKGWILAMDRTNWRFGRIDILAFIVSHGEVGISICWKMLPKARRCAESPENCRKLPLASGITYTVEFSEDLTNWVAAEPMGEDATSIDGIFERVIHTDSVTAPAKRFVRVRVTAN